MPKAASARKDERYEFRLSSSDRALLQRAAELRGLKFSEFVLQAVRERAESTLRENDIILLTGEDRRVFVDALMNPPRLNRKLRKAFERHREAVS